MRVVLFDKSDIEYALLKIIEPKKVIRTMAWVSNIIYHSSYLCKYAPWT